MSQITQKTIQRISSQSLLNQIHNLIMSNNERNKHNLITSKKEIILYLPRQPRIRMSVLRCDDVEKCMLDKIRRKIWGAAANNKSATL